MDRHPLLNRVTSLLSHFGFTYQSFADSNSSFDLIARKQNVVLIVKVLSNIDSMRAEHARDLQKLTQVFNAHSLIVGEKTKVFDLHANVLYERYNLPVLSLQGFESLLSQRMPVQRSFKGKDVVELDSQKLRAEREALKLTLKELSERLGVSLESLHRYEHGFPAQLDVAERLEELLHTKLIRGINVFDYTYDTATPKEPVSLPTALDQLEELGLKLSVFERAPLTAAGTEHRLLISHVENPLNVTKRAYLLERTRKIVKQPGLIVTKLKKVTHVGNVPVLNEDELSTFSSIRDVLKTIGEKQNPKKHSKK